jgi:hypothetical protein
MKLIVVTLLLVAPLFASQPDCKGNPKLIGSCYIVHGRITQGADTVRLWLWPVGTKRMLGVTGGPVPDDAEAPIYPSSLKFDANTNAIYGGFEVCPFTPERKGAIQMVCIESVSNPVVKRQ